jgi:hypothetical protein
VYARHGWQAALLTGMALPVAALVYWLGELVQQTGALRKAA